MGSVLVRIALLPVTGDASRVSRIFLTLSGKESEKCQEEYYAYRHHANLLPSEQEKSSALHCHPCPFLRTPEHGVENPHLANPILEGGIINRRLLIHHSSVEAAKDLLEGVRIALAVPARQVGVAPGLRPHEHGIFDLNFVRRIAMAEPKVLGRFASPCHGCLGTEDFDEQTVLATPGNLAHRKRPSGVLAHA